MATASYEEILIIAERHRRDLPDSFFVDLRLVQSSLAAGQLPAEIRERSLRFTGRTVPKKSRKAKKRSWSPEIGAAILVQLHQLLCTDDPYYAKVREGGQQLSGPAVTAVAVCVADLLGAEVGLATGAVAFLSLAILKVGTRVFCNLIGDPETLPPTESPG